MLRLWKIAPDWEGDAPRSAPGSYRVASNLCIDRMTPAPAVERRADARGRRRGPGGVAQGSPRRPATAPAALETAPRRPPRAPGRLAIVLRHFEDRSNPEIAAVLELSVEAVESLLARGRRALAAALSGRRAELEFSE